MIARIVDNKWIYLEQITVQEEDILDKDMSVKHPRQQYLDLSGGFFDGIFHKYNRFHHRFARPLMREFLGVCKKHGFPVSISDERPPAKYPRPDPNIIDQNFLHGITLDDHQVQAIKAACHGDEVGIVSCKTGGGKTEMMAGIAKAYNCPTVILCDMTVVVNQIKDRLELRKAAEEIGMFYAGRRPNGQQIIVGSFQSLIIPPQPEKKPHDSPEKYAKKLAAWKTRKTNARKLREIIAKCELLLVDECDTATSKQWKNLFWHWFQGRYKFGFSGTPFDPARPVQNMSLKEHLGSIIYHVDKEVLEDIHRIIPVTYTAIAFGDEKLSQDKSAYDIALKEHLIDNPTFHKLVTKLCEKSIGDDKSHGVMILVESKPLGYALETAIPGAKFICGDHPMSKRKKVIAAFENREIQVIIGGKIVKRGLDLKGGCETLIIATGGKLQSDLSQKVGRAVRVNKRGFAIIYDFFFLCNYYLYAHSRGRLKTVVAMGYPTKVVFRYGTVEGEKFIASRFRRPRPK